MLAALAALAALLLGPVAAVDHVVTVVGSTVTSTVDAVTPVSVAHLG